MIRCILKLLLRDWLHYWLYRLCWLLRSRPSRGSWLRYWTQLFRCPKGTRRIGPKPLSKPGQSSNHRLQRDRRSRLWGLVWPTPANPDHLLDVPPLCISLWSQCARPGHLRSRSIQVMIQLVCHVALIESANVLLGLIERSNDSPLRLRHQIAARIGIKWPVRSCWQTRSSPASLCALEPGHRIGHTAVHFRAHEIVLNPQSLFGRSCRLPCFLMGASKGRSLGRRKRRGKLSMNLASDAGIQPLNLSLRHRAQSVPLQDLVLQTQVFLLIGLPVDLAEDQLLLKTLHHRMTFNLLVCPRQVRVCQGILRFQSLRQSFKSHCLCCVGHCLMTLNQWIHHSGMLPLLLMPGNLLLHCCRLCLQMGKLIREPLPALLVLLAHRGKLLRTIGNLSLEGLNVQGVHFTQARQEFLNLLIGKILMADLPLLKLKLPRKHLLSLSDVLDSPRHAHLVHLLALGEIKRLNPSLRIDVEQLLRPGLRISDRLKLPLDTSREPFLMLIEQRGLLLRLLVSLLTLNILVDYLALPLPILQGVEPRFNLRDEVVLLIVGKVRIGHDARSRLTKPGEPRLLSLAKLDVVQLCL